MVNQRIIASLMGACLIVLLLTYRSFETEFVFYCSWIAGVFVTVMHLGITALKMTIDKVTVQIGTFVTLWFAIGLMVSPFAYDLHEHLKVLVISTFYMCTSVFIAEYLIKSRINIKKYTFVMLFTWTAINLVLLGSFFLEIYEPEKHDFSGVFHDRNVFSITTLIVVAFAASHVDRTSRRVCLYVLYFCVTVCFAMIVISKSITGILGIFVLVFLYCQRYSAWTRVFALVALCSILAITLLTENPISIRASRFAMAIMGDIESLNTNESAYLRLYLIKNGLDLIMQNPWFGVGLNNAKEFVVWPDRGYGSFLHNTYLDIFTSGGLPLLLVYYCPIVYSFTSLVRNRKQVKRYLDENSYHLWKLAFSCISLKLFCDLTWTTYFEYFMVFSITFSLYITFYLKRSLISKAFEKSTQSF
jgi:O-antigen ligase